jgi:hypothetical protein
MRSPRGRWSPTAPMISPGRAAKVGREQTKGETPSGVAGGRGSGTQRTAEAKKVATYQAAPAS